MQNMWSNMKAINRRSFLRNGLSTAGAATAGMGLLTTSTSAVADDDLLGGHGFLTRGDAAMLRFAAAAEIIETDFWVSTTNSAESRTVKCPEEQEIQPMPRHSPSWTTTWPSTSTTTRTTKTPTRTSSTPTSPPRARQLSVSNNFALYRVARPQVPAENSVSPT